MLCLSWQGYAQRYFLSSKTRGVRMAKDLPVSGHNTVAGHALEEEIYISASAVQGGKLTQRNCLVSRLLLKKKKRTSSAPPVLLKRNNNARCTLYKAWPCQHTGGVLREGLCSGFQVTVRCRCKTHSKQLYLANTRSATDIHRSRILQYLESLR